MDKWEYCLLTWTAGVVSDQQKQQLEDAGFEGEFRPGEGGGTIAQLGTVTYFGDSDSKRVVDLNDKIAALGRDGWELVSRSDGSMSNPVEQFWFKRRIQE